MQWYYADGEDRVGPIDDNALNKLISESQITSETLVWNETMTDWQKLGSLSPKDPDDTSASTGEPVCSQCLNTFPEEDLIRYEGLLVCAACKPSFFQKVKEGVIVASSEPSERYGSLEKGLKGDYDFRISEILKEAWELTKGMKGPVIGGAVIAYVIVFGLSFLMGLLTHSMAGSGSTGMIIGMQVLEQLVSTAITLPMWAGIMMIGIRRSVGLPISFSMVFQYYNCTVSLIVAYIMYMIFVGIGFILLIIPGIYLSVAYYLATPLIVDRNFSPWRALETSRKAATHRWFKIFGLGLAMTLIIMLSMIPIGIGLIWTMPMGVAVYGILYRDIFGVEPAGE